MTIILCLHAVNTKIFTMHYFCEKLAVFFYQMGFSRFNFSLELRFLLIFFCTFFFFVCSKDLSLNSFAKICCYLAIRLHMKSLWTILPINHVKSKESPKVPWPHQFLSFFQVVPSNLAWFTFFERCLVGKETKRSKLLSFFH